LETLPKQSKWGEQEILAGRILDVNAEVGGGSQRELVSLEVECQEGCRGCVLDGDEAGRRHRSTCRKT
jgi:hypothetical protein